MRQYILSGALIAFCGLNVSGQYVQLMTADSIAAPVSINLIPLKGGKEQTLLTDKKGRVLLPESGYPYRILIHSMSYEPVKDTIGGRRDKYIWLLAKTMGEVVITGQYEPVSLDNAVQRIEVIDRKKIDAMAAQNLRDVLTNQLEIRISYDPILSSAMNMQGSRNYGADAKILIDGVPVVGRVDGAVDLSQINLANIERIEIIKGPMSVSYGTDAIAGTVNLITKKNVKRGWETYGGTYYETPGTYNVNAGGGIRAKGHSLRFDGFRNFFGGWNPDNDVSFFDFESRPADASRVMLWKPREQYQGGLQYVYAHGKTTINYKSSYFYEVITNRGAPLQPYGEMAFDNRFHTWRKDNAVFVNTSAGKGKQINVFAAYNAYKRIKTEVANDLTTLAETADADWQDTSKYSEVNSRGVLTSGTSGRKLNYEVGYDVNIQYANSTQIEDRKQEMGNYAAYGSAEYRPFEQFTIRPGFRYSYNTRYTAPLIPSINLMYKAFDGVTFRASYARGFRQPGLKDLYFDFVDINHNIHGNPDLRAEYSDNYLASASYAGKVQEVGVKVNLSAYYNNVNDLITLVQPTGGTTNEYWYQNISNFITKGAQANVDATFNALSVGVGGSYIGTYNPLSESRDVPDFSYSPELRGSVMYTMKEYGLSVAAFFKYTGKAVVYEIDEKTEIISQSRMNNYSIADVTMTKELWKKRLRLSAGCKNLFDVSNVASGSTGGGGAHSGGTATAAIGMGRYYFFKTEFNFSK